MRSAQSYSVTKGLAASSPTGIELIKALYPRGCELPTGRTFVRYNLIRLKQARLDLVPNASGFGEAVKVAKMPSPERSFPTAERQQIRDGSVFTKPTSRDIKPNTKGDGFTGIHNWPS